MSDYRNHSKNSLRSDSFSCRFACFAYATQESKKIPIIVHPLKTSSCGMFSRIYSRKHGVRSAVIDFVACYRRDARMFSKINIIMANPEGAKAREPYQNLDGGRSLPGVN